MVGTKIADREVDRFSARSDTPDAVRLHTAIDFNLQCNDLGEKSCSNLLEQSFLCGYAD